MSRDFPLQNAPLPKLTAVLVKSAVFFQQCNGVWQVAFFPFVNKVGIIKQVLCSGFPPHAPSRSFRVREGWRPIQINQCRHHEEWDLPWGQVGTNSTALQSEHASSWKHGAAPPTEYFIVPINMVDVGVLSNAHLWFAPLLPFCVGLLSLSDTSQQGDDPAQRPWHCASTRAVSHPMGSDNFCARFWLQLTGSFVIYSIKLDKIQPSHYRLRVIWCLTEQHGEL